MKGHARRHGLRELSKQSGAIFELTPELWRDVIPKVDQVEIIDEPFLAGAAAGAGGDRDTTSAVGGAEPGERPHPNWAIGRESGDRLEGGVVADSLLVQVVLTNRTARVQARGAGSGPPHRDDRDAPVRGTQIRRRSIDTHRLARSRRKMTRVARLRPRRFRLTCVPKVGLRGSRLRGCASGRACATRRCN
jgi:hypothetical protein